MSPQKVPVEERLFSLVLTLVATEQGLTKNEILSSVQGYSSRFREGGDNSALERQFERDKDDIRELGIPLETVEDPGDPGNNQALRYRIPKAAYDLPADIEFSAQEMALLRLAARVWREGSLSADSRRAIMKLRTLGVEADDPLVGFAPQVRIREAAFEPLEVALERSVVVNFEYLKPGEGLPTKRSVEPLALVQFHGRWLLHAHDRGADAPRTFLISRIIGRPRVTQIAFERHGTDYAARAMDELQAIWERNAAELDVVAATDAWVRLTKREDTRVNDEGNLLVHYSDTALLADELAGYGPEVRVVWPPRLVQAVRERLATTLATHSEGVDAHG
ncbi:helix-turn-helix transcriptional regulator [Humibacter ginsenosidimutans]|uniref:WYL domain-containing protein n=1 Tax=Humibacter ginsenosidimutans TaxID=2599293 RepID=A0A5B8LZD1_9MICO|nr:WYL domain-containing protein [Humibacter ginsenosidimutans]QDZ13717.1 WYL domain-containing protein [Humibacter ginsenosidimutans]